MSKVKVENMRSSNRNDVHNQFKIYTDDGVYFQSYKYIIAFIPRKITNNTEVDGKIKLDINKWDYSKITGKYRNQFLGEKKAETQKKIDSGEYELIDLNK